MLKNLVSGRHRQRSQTRSAAHLGGVTVNELLLAERHQLARVEGIDTLNRSSGGESPAGAALHATKVMIRIVCVNTRSTSACYQSPKLKIRSKGLALTLQGIR